MFILLQFGRKDSKAWLDAQINDLGWPENVFKSAFFGDRQAQYALDADLRGGPEKI